MLHNLLNTEQQKSWAREYAMRLVAVAALALTAVVLVGVLALVPSYAYLTSELMAADDKQTASTTESTTDAQARETLRRGAATVALLGSRLTEAPLTDIIREAFDERPDGVLVTGMAFDRARGALTVGGVASTRSGLVSYSRNLEANPRFSNVQLPISDLAKNTDLPFRITFAVDAANTP